jgi:hypothetical protein
MARPREILFVDPSVSDLDMIRGGLRPEVEAIDSRCITFDIWRNVNFLSMIRFGMRVEEPVFAGLQYDLLRKWAPTAIGRSCKGFTSAAAKPLWAELISVWSRTTSSIRRDQRPRTKRGLIHEKGHVRNRAAPS